MLYRSANPHGGDIYAEDVKLDFSANINPLGTPPSVLEAMKAALSGAAHYPDPYCRKAVRAISEHESVPEKNILLGNGAAELIYSYCSALNPRKALIPVPAFSEYETALRLNDCEIIHYPLLPSDNFRPGSGLLEKIMQEKPDVVFLGNPNNPAGRTLDPEFSKKLITLCEISGTFIFIDECFSDLSDNCHEMKEFFDDSQNLFILKSLTKSHALAGVRVGYCLCPDQNLLAKMSETVQPWNVSAIAQSAVPAAMKETEYLAESKKLIREERIRLTADLIASGCSVIPSDTNFILFQAPPGLDLYLKTMGIAIRNCRNFAGLDDGWYRIAVRQRSDNEILISYIRKFMEEAA